MKINHIGIFVILITLVFGACSNEDSLSGADTVKKTVSIRTRAASADASENELINYWWMVFVDASGNVSLILDRPSGNTNPVDYEEVEFEIPRGTYTVYAFANINRDSLGLDFTVGQPVPDLKEVLWDRAVQADGLIPMTGVLNGVAFSNSSSDYFTIEVVRLWAKMCFEFTNESNSTVTVTNISITPALTDKVSLLPDYSLLGKSPVLPADAKCEQLIHHTDLQIVPGAQPVNETFYLLESTAVSHPTGHYPISFDLKYGDGSQRTVSVLAYQLEHINRNDFVKIPVLFTDWFVNLNVLFYPPIGGYPAVLLESKDDEYYAKFGSGGKFVIRPAVSTSAGNVIPSEDVEIDLSTSDTDSILSKAPERDAKTGEIIGEIKDGVQGRAVVTLTIKIKTEDLEYSILRKFYIIRQNS